MGKIEVEENLLEHKEQQQPTHTHTHTHLGCDGRSDGKTPYISSMLACPEKCLSDICDMSLYLFDLFDQNKAHA
eukprot:scaffold25696_cov83-Cylindrotheca_fusiformis.AAC.2